jgi:protein gp37
MGESTKIEWCHHTFNPWWGCVRVSPGCEHCYAESFAKRVGQKVWGVKSPRRFFGDKHWAEPLKWNKAAAEAGERHRVFCASMADVFEDRRDLDEHRERLWSLIRQTPHLDWLLLTKRPENFKALLPADWGDGYRNVWLGTTAEDQKRLMDRLQHLLVTPAAVRFLSCEPLLEQLDLYFFEAAVLDWIIVGGESGPGSRPFDVEWARDVKQLGGHFMDTAVDGPVPYSARRKLSDAKGGDMAEWPEDLRVRQFPEARHG